MTISGDFWRLPSQYVCKAQSAGKMTHTGLAFSKQPFCDWYVQGHERKAKCAKNPMSLGGFSSFLEQFFGHFRLENGLPV